MAYIWPAPYHQQDSIPSTSDGPSTRHRQNATMADKSAVAQGCPCSSCSIVRHNDIPAAHAIEYQNQFLAGNNAVQYANQSLGHGVNNPTGMGARTSSQTRAQTIPPQAQLQSAQGNAAYAPSHTGRAAGPPHAQTNVVLDQVQDLDLTVKESLMRLARRYVNSPESLVNAVRLEPGPSGRLQVVITLDIAEIL
ncbi:hypothetical protein BC826DRAFT_995258 [Russula brevipes]|nr:hypothetical protein BC826DRAFT_995258 [Russula brevipes]